MPAGFSLNTQIHGRNSVFFSGFSDCFFERNSGVKGREIRLKKEAEKEGKDAQRPYKSLSACTAYIDLIFIS